MNYFLLSGIVLQILLFDCLVSQACGPDQFQCKNRRCIRQGVTCDGEDDCGDNSDELNSLCTTCTDDQFVCTNDRNCIALNLKCNKVADCDDGTDEHDCEECSDGLVPCLNTSRCYKAEEKCDGFSDCADNSDEFDCPNTRTGSTTVVVPTIPKKSSVIPKKTTPVIPTKITADDISTISTTTTGDDSVDIKKVQDYSTIIIISVVVVGLLLITIVVTLGMIFVVSKKYRSNPKIKPLSLEERAAYLNQEPRRAANTYTGGYYATSGERGSVHSGEYDDVKGPQCIECTDNIYNTIDVDLGTDEETYDDTAA